MLIFRKIRIVAILILLSMYLGSLEATEKQIADLEEDIASLKAQLAEVSGPGNASSQLLLNIEKAKAEIEKTKAEIPEKEKMIASKTFLLQVYQSAFRVSSAMIAGENLGAIQLTTGETIPGASFLSVQNGGILVQTGTGSRLIPISQLPSSLSGKLTLPPQIALPTATLDAVKAVKPAFLKTKEEIAMAGSPEPEATAASSSPANSGAAGSAPDEYQQIQQRNAARQKQIAEIKTRYTGLFAEKKKARAEKASAESGFRSAKIKKSKSEVDSTLAPLNAKIMEIEDEEARLRAELSRIQSEFE